MIRFKSYKKFQHTAARRRLELPTSTANAYMSFNTQPPEGGWEADNGLKNPMQVSTHSRPKAAGIK